jgi:transcriptional antiterminator NusG
MAGSLLWPRRSLRIRRKGEWKKYLAPIFPGYFFLELEKVDLQTYSRMKSLPGFSQFLPSNRNIKPLDQHDTSLLAHFLQFGEVVDQSIVTYDENDRIVVLAGPLKGLEGRITKVDRRKNRAKVVLDLCKNSFTLDFGFELLENLSWHSPV